MYYLIRKDNRNIEATEYNAPTKLQSFTSFTENLSPVEYLDISGRLNESDSSKVQAALETSWRTSTQKTNFKVKILSLNSKFLSTTWKKVTKVKYAVESEVKDTPSRKLIQDQLDEVGLNLCNCVSQKERKVAIKAERSQIDKTVVSEAIKSAWKNKNTEINGTFTADIEIESARRRRAATGGSGLTASDG